jgi:hypothetical protein
LSIFGRAADKMPALQRKNERKIAAIEIKMRGDGNAPRELLPCSQCDAVRIAGRPCGQCGFMPKRPAEYVNRRDGQQRRGEARVLFGLASLDVCARATPWCGRLSLQGAL